MAKQIVRTEQAKADLRAIEQPIALQILKTLGRYILTGEGATKQLKSITPPLIRLRAQNHRVFFRRHDDYFKIERILDRKEAYRRWATKQRRPSTPAQNAATEPTGATGGMPAAGSRSGGCRGNGYCDPHRHQRGCSCQTVMS